MSWFDDQIREKKELDEELVEESLISVAASVLGKKGTRELSDERTLAKGAIDEIMKCYHFKPVPFPENVKDADEGIEQCLRPYGMMRRRVRLDEHWYKKAYGPMLGRLSASSRTDHSAGLTGGVEQEKESAESPADIPVALLPGRLGGYTYVDPRNGIKSRVNSKTAESIRVDAYCFYKPLPAKKLSIRDLIVYMIGCLSFSDIMRVVVASLLYSLVTLLVPNMTQTVIGPVVTMGSTNLLVTVGITLLMIRLSMVLFDASKEMVVERMKLSTSLCVEAAVMTRLLQLNVAFFRKHNSGDLSTRAISIQELCDIIIEEFFGMGLLSLTSLVNIVQIVRYGSVLVFPALTVIALTTVTMVFGTYLRVRITEKHLHHEAELKGMEYALVSGIRKLRLTGSENRAFARWASTYAGGAKLEYDPPLFLKIESVIQKAIILCGTLAIYYLAVDSRIDVDDYYAFNSAYGIIMGAFTMLGASVVELSRIKPSLKLAEPILKAVPEIDEKKKKDINVRGHIELSHVSFRYKKSMPYLLKDVSFEIKPGEYVAIVGKTGCGKSTLVRLLLGFETPEKGVVFYGRQDISKADLRSLRSQIGVVMQGGELIPGSIYENIALVSPGLSVSDAWEAADIAGIGDDIRQMPMGMSTVISEGQGGISGGQKQRLMIARAIASKPKLLIFDEATSALDNRTQKRVTDALAGLDCTRIVIAHRLSTIRDCDRVLVLEDGIITERTE
ncbi:MAG: ATP-binding cassette domain-containing protein [Eubacterium sp.]|nr:ATP-binding cassette domain-containing protein [Eubacterium sp.]